jgi:immunity protein 22 of polymorphic toxin system
MAQHSVYEFEAEGVVSIWVATIPRSRIPEDYFQANYDAEDDEPFSPFSEEFGFGYYDHDSVESNASTDRPKTIERLLGECSFAASFVGEAVAAAERLSLDKTDFVFLLYDIKYPPEVTGVSRSEYMAFLGSFRYDPESESAFPSEG